MTSDRILFVIKDRVLALAMAQGRFKFGSVPGKDI
jgi:hypothetical protein